MTNRLDRIRSWLQGLGTTGAVANALDELERRAEEHAMLVALEERVPVARHPGAEAA